jgi:acetyltransferase-like isoleucine patch superfamily enzyme
VRPPPPARAGARLEPAATGRWYRVLAIRVLAYLTNYVVSGVPSFTLRHGWYRRVLGIEIGRKTGISLGCFVWSYGPRQLRRGGLTIGSFTRINRDCCLDARGGLSIGDNVSISLETMILTAAHVVDDPAFPVENRPVVVEDHVYIGARALIMPGVTLGRGSVVAAGAVVTRDVEPLAIVAGVPAREIGTRAATATQYTLEQPLPLLE